MKLSHIIAAAGLALAATGGAQAQPVRHERTVVTTHTTTVTHQGRGWHHPRCHSEWRHHHRVQVCR